MPDYPGFQVQTLLPRGEGKQVEILCHSLAGGLSVGDNVRLYPGGQELKIRSVEEVEEMVRLRIKGISRTSLLPGSVIVSAGLPVSEEKEGLFLHDGQNIPSETEAVRGGLCETFNRERLIGRGSFGREGSFITVRFSDRYPMVPGMQCTILNADSTPRKLTLLWPGRPDRDELRRLEASAARRPEPHPSAEDVYRRILLTRGFVCIPPDFPDIDDTEIHRVGNWLIRKSIAVTLERKVLKLASRPGGANNTILRIDNKPFELVRAIANDMVEEQKLQLRQGWYFPPGLPPLSPFHRGWLSKVKDAGEEGLRISSLKKDADSEALTVLGRSGYIRGGIDLWIAPEIVETLTNRLLDGMKAGDSLNMADARVRLGGSRVRTIELLLILEEDARLKPSEEGEERIVQ